MLGAQTLDPNGLRAAAAVGREYLVSTAAADAALHVTGKEGLHVSLPATAGQVWYQANTPAPPAYSCVTWGQITKPVATNFTGTGSVHGPVPPNGSSDQRQGDGSLVAAPPTPGAPNRAAPPPSLPPPAQIGPPAESHIALTGVARRRAKLSFTVLGGTNAAALQSIVVGLPAGLSFNAKKLARGLTIKGPGGGRLKLSSHLGPGAVTITLKTAAMTVSATIGGSALTVSRTLAAEIKRHKVKSLTVVVRATDVSGTTTGVIDPDQIPWVPYEGHPNIFVKPLRLNRRTGVWVTLTKVVGASQINRHYHVGPVSGFVLEGSWDYAEKDWVARAGMVVWEPPGDIHTLMSSEGTVTMFVLEGALLYVDEQDNVVGHEDVLSHMKLYVDYCRSQGIEPLDIDY